MLAVAVDPDAAVGRDLHGVVAVAAANLDRASAVRVDRVVARAGVDLAVGAVHGVEADRVVAAAAEDAVGAAPAGDVVVAVPAEDLVAAAAPEDAVIAWPAVEDVHAIARAGRQAVAPQDVVASEAEQRVRATRAGELVVLLGAAHDLAAGGVRVGADAHQRVRGRLGLDPDLAVDD